MVEQTPDQDCAQVWEIALCESRRGGEMEVRADLRSVGANPAVLRVRAQRLKIAV